MAQQQAQQQEQEEEETVEGAQGAYPTPLLELLEPVTGAVASLLGRDVGHGVVPLPKPRATAAKGKTHEEKAGAWWRGVWTRHRGFALSLLRWAGLVALGALILLALCVGAYCLRPMCGCLHPASRLKQLTTVRA